MLDPNPIRVLLPRYPFRNFSLLSHYNTTTGRCFHKYDAAPKFLSRICHDPFDSIQFCAKGLKGFLLSVIMLGDESKYEVVVKEIQRLERDNGQNSSVGAAAEMVVFVCGEDGVLAALEACVRDVSKGASEGRVLNFSSAEYPCLIVEMTTYGDPTFLSPPPPTNNGGAIAASIIVTIIVLIVIAFISRACARKFRTAIVSELQYAVATAPPVSSNVVQVWQIDAPTMERFLQDLAKEKPVADFGLAKLCNRDNTHNSSIGYKGTPGYSAPEFLLNNYPITHKCDVYSFGMLLFEIVGRRRNARVGSTDSLDWFPKHVWDEYEKGELAAMILSNGIEEKDIDRAQIMALVALWCVQDSPVARPPMSAVVKMLEGGVEIMPPPKPFHYLFSVGINVLNPPTYTGNSLDYSTSDGANSYWYKEQTTTIMAKYEIQIASS
ncbi:hypothetical protein Vadar_017932 [Vaccinium darrowii]|uniref:Uncharacterized protein n=1 Tax=Vaccinium darrowii TaxID=229202 RepID=A0ACB7X2D2_9ERIC|nr:hypothetical protein Vadar_017932 [Vaccinium darrowii]